MQITDEMLYQYAPQAREIWLDTLLRQDEIPYFTCSNRFQRKMERLLRQQRRSPQANRALHNLKRIVAVFLIAVTITFAGLMTVEAVRQKVIEFVVHVYHEFTQYKFSSDSEAAALPEIRFGYLPEGMKIKSDEMFPDYYRRTLFEDGSEHYLVLNISVHDKYSAATLHIDTEDAQVMTRIIQGREVTIVSKNGTNSILWDDETVTYMGQSNLAFSELEAFIAGLSAQP